VLHAVRVTNFSDLLGMYLLLHIRIYDMCAPTIFPCEEGGRPDDEAAYNLILQKLLQKSCHMYKCNTILFANAFMYVQIHVP
jgi:hypothetical protein